MHLDQVILQNGLLGSVLLAVGLVVFAESGLLIGFFLPGDTLLLGAGILAAGGLLPIHWLVVVVVLAAIIGDNVGYSIGRRTGKRLLNKPDGIVFRHEHIARAEKFYELHGGKTIILARFVPIVRTFAPMVAGMSKMPRERFILFNVFGGLLWGAGLTLLGYWFGSVVPAVKHYIEPTFIGVTLLTIAIIFYHLFKDAKTRRRLGQKVKLIIRTILLNKKVD